jgi:hypothetical protein
LAVFSCFTGHFTASVVNKKQLCVDFVAQIARPYKEFYSDTHEYRLELRYLELTFSMYEV